MEVLVSRRYFQTDQVTNWGLKFLVHKLNMKIVTSFFSVVFCCCLFKREGLSRLESNF